MTKKAKHKHDAGAQIKDEEQTLAKGGAYQDYVLLRREKGDKTKIAALEVKYPDFRDAYKNAAPEGHETEESE